MDNSPNLQLPYIAAAQAQKHVTHNEAIRALDAIVQLSVLDRDLASPPTNPSDGESYLVAIGGSGDWTGHDGDVAAWQDGVWTFYSPQEGWIAWISDETAAVGFDGVNWGPIASGGGSANVNPTPLVGVNATADSTNRLSVGSPATLFNHEGSDHQLKINKNAAADNGSMLFQSGFSGRAEIGLTGDDDLHLKVSGDGSVWNEALVVDRSSGVVSFPNTSLGAGGSGRPDVIVEDQKSSGSHGGASISGTQTRQLNTLVFNLNSLASLASNQFTLPAGDYYISFVVPAMRVGSYQASLRNVTDSNTAIVGSTGYAHKTTSMIVQSSGCGTVTLAASTTFYLRHYTETAYTYGLGFASSAGLGELYSRVSIWKL